MTANPTEARQDELVEWKNCLFWEERAHYEPCNNGTSEYQCGYELICKKGGDTDEEKCKQCPAL